MESLESQIIHYGDKKQFNKVNKLVKETDIHTIYAQIDKLLLHQKFLKYLGYVFESCQLDEKWAHRKKIKVIEYCLKQIQQKHQCMNREILDQIIYKIREYIQVSCFKPEHLDKICNWLVERIDTGNVGDTSWMELLPEILRKMCTYEKIDYQDELISTEMYNTAVIKRILGISWKNEIIISLVGMFLRIKLTPEESQTLLRKITERFATLDPATIPPLVYHLLQLKMSDDSNILFIKLQQYYGNTIYNNGTYVGSVYSESIGTDISSESYQKLVESERTTLYHIYDAFHRNCVQQYIKYLTNSYKLPESVLHPFNLTLLIMCSNNLGRGSNMNVIKSSMLRYYIEEDKRRKFYFKENVPSRFSVTMSLKQIIEISIKNRDVTIDGLIKLAFVLFEAMPPLGRDAYYEKLYKTANFILVSIIEKETNKVKSIMINIVNAMTDPRYAPQIIDCFTIIGSRFAYATLQNISTIMTNFNNILMVSNHHLSSVLEIVTNLVRHSPKVMVDLMSQLEQLLFSSPYEKSLNAITAYLKLIKHLKINSGASLSQRSSESAYSLSSQMSVSRLPGGGTCIFTNEAICLEVINKFQHARSRMHPEMKQHLYISLPEVADKNNELAVPLMQFLVESYTYFQNEDDLPPLSFNKTCEVDGDEMKIIDSISKMTMAIALILSNVQDNSGREKIMFDTIADRMVTSDVEHFMQNQDVDLMLDSAESQREIYIICEAMATYEAFMTYYILSWNAASDEQYPRRIKGLFKGYKRLADYFKHYSKSKKANKKNSTIQSQASTANVTRGLNKHKLKVPSSIMPLHCFNKIVELLYCEEVTWTSSDFANILKSQISFHTYILESLITVIQNCSQIKHKYSSNAKYYKKHFESLDNILYDRCVKRYKTLIEFDIIVATQTLEVFYHAAITRQQIKHLWEVDRHSQEIDETDVEELHAIKALRERLITVQTLFDSIDMDDDADTCKTVTAVVNILGFLIKELSNNMDQMEVVNWLKNTCRDKAIQPKATANSFLGILLNTSGVQTSSLVVIRLIVGALSSTIGLKAESQTEGGAMEIIKETTAPLILQTLLAEIKAYLDDLDWIVERIRQEYNYFLILRGPGIENGHDEVRRKERNICGKLTEILTVLSLINQLNIISGSQTDQIMKTNIHFFNTMTNLGKYLLSTSTANNLAFQSARFDGLVRTTAKVLLPVLYQHVDFIKQTPEDGAQLFKRPAERNKALSSTPALILAQEQFKKVLMQITKKTKVDILKYVGMGKSSGFRMRDIKAALREGDVPVESDESDSDENTSNQVESADLDSNSIVPTTSRGQRTTLVEDSDPESEEEVIVPVKKRRQK